MPSKGPPPPKNLDLGGEAAWQGGIQAISQATDAAVIKCFVWRRLQTLARIRYVPDPTVLMNLGCEAMLQAIEGLAQDDPCLCLDHPCLRLLYAKHSGSLTDNQAREINEWETSAPGETVIEHIRAALMSSWRDVPAVIFGDSACCNIFKRSKPSMIQYFV